MLISSVDELTACLGDEFVILFGSAVSGANLPRVPMVPTLRTSLLESAAELLRTGTYSQRLLAQYALSLTPKGSQDYQQILETTKFETFLLKLTRIVGKQQVDDLLVRLYSCTGDQYGPNHSAIAFLLKVRRCLAALTTNFDNALELCYPELRVLDQMTVPTEIPRRGDTPWLLKLHGDANARTCIATSLELSQAKLQNRYAYVRNLLKDRNILVLGYGGKGDVDIAPQLWNLEARLLWCIRDVSEVNPDSEYLNRVDVLCDLSQPLSSRSEASRPNLLLQFASQFGWPGVSVGTEHPWKNGLKQWIRTLSIDEISEFVLSLHSWNTNWPSVHVSYVRWLESNTAESEYQLTSSELQISAYNSAEKGLRKALKSVSRSSLMHRRMHQQLGFILWRKGKFEAALRTFAPAIDLSTYIEPSLSASLTEVSQQAARQFLETIDEIMAYCPRLAERRQIYEIWQVARIMNYLGQAEKLLIEDEYLARIALLRINYWIGAPISLEEVRELFDEALAMEEWESAALTAQLLLLLTEGAANRELVTINEILRKRGDVKLHRKNLAYLVYSKLRMEAPILFKALNGRLVMPAGILLREVVYYQRRRLWRSHFESDAYF